MGHTNCGAIDATLSELQLPIDQRSETTHAIVHRISPSVETLLETELIHNPEELRRAAGRSNVRASVAHLKHGSRTLEQMTTSKELQIVGAEYCLESGEVEFFEDL